MELRILAAGDEDALERFLARHAHTTMFLRANLREAGLEDHGEPYQGTYAAACHGRQIVGVAAHYWNGMIVLEAPRALEGVVRAAAAGSGRPVAGLIGVRAQVAAARAALGLQALATRLDSVEDLLFLDLDRLRVPAALEQGRVRCRVPHAAELELVTGWATVYALETLGEPEGPELLASSRARILRAQAEARHWILEEAGRPVAYSAFNAALPDCVQVGGVFTPPELRGRGYARCVVAGSLLSARARGVESSILFTDTANAPAQAAYRSLGYQRVGDYALVTFAEPWSP